MLSVKLIFNLVYFVVFCFFFLAIKSLKNYVYREAEREFVTIIVKKHTKNNLALTEISIFVNFVLGSDCCRTATFQSVPKYIYASRM